MSKLNPLYERWDIKYFYKLHLERMEQMEEVPVSYPRFYVRLKSWMMLRDAIYTPSNRNMARYNMKPKPTWKEKLHNILIRFISFFK